MARASDKSLVTDFKQFVLDHKDEIEAIKLLYSKPVPGRAALSPRAGARGEAHAAPFGVQPDDAGSVRHLWDVHAAAEPESVKSGAASASGRSGRARATRDPSERAGSCRACGRSRARTTRPGSRNRRKPARVHARAAPLARRYQQPHTQRASPSSRSISRRCRSTGWAVWGRFTEFSAIGCRSCWMS